MKTLAASLDAFNEAIAAANQPVYGNGRAPGQMFAISKGGLIRDSQPYSLFNVFKGFQQKDFSLCKGERLVHEDLLKAGYDAADSGMLIPFDPYTIERQCASMKGIGAKMCKGDRNIPDGEVFSCPEIGRAHV